MFIPCISFLVAFTIFLFIRLFTYFYYYNTTNEEQLKTKVNIELYSFFACFGWYFLSLLIWLLYPQICYWVFSSIATECNGYPGCPFYHEAIGRIFWGYHTDTLNIYNKYKPFKN
jgi:hypothetical protein